MMKSAIYWLNVTGSIFDLILLGRVLGLRLFSLYAFITLDCVLSVFADSAGFYLGWDSPENTRVWLYTRLLYGLVTPLIAWDIFEEVKGRVTKLRRLEAIRMVSAVLVVGLSGSIFIGISSMAADVSFGAAVSTLGLFLWGGSSVASLLFVWRMFRTLRREAEPLPTNTRIWSVYYLLNLSAAILSCGLALAASDLKFGDNVLDVVTVILMFYGIVITGWCALRIRSVPNHNSETAE